MSVPVGKRGHNTLEVWQKSVQLTKYTMEIVGNKKNFPGRYQRMNDSLVDTAWHISERLWLANNVYVGKGCDPRAIGDRLHLQQEAISLCRSMLFQIDLAGKVLHRPTGKTEYWAEMTKSVLDMARKWHESDRRRLAHRD